MHHTQPNTNGSYSVKIGDTFKCLHCGNPSKPAQRSGRPVKYCGKTCAGKAKVVAKQHRDCVHCGKPFELSVKHKEKKYCSFACSHEANFDPSLKTIRTCSVCQSEFETYTARPKKYCSNPCRHKGKAIVAGSTFTEAGGIIGESGYVRITPPEGGSRVYEHRYVMEQFIGRALLDHENVHHKDGNRSNNDLSNLEIWSCTQPSGQRIEDKVAWAVEILKLYDPAKLAAD